MATIKSYSDLQQSKKLAEVLPIESADMHYWLAWSGGVSEEKRNTPKVDKPRKDAIKTYWCPCWSLASLVEGLPEVIDFDDDDNDYALEILKENGLYYISYGNPIMGEILNIEPQENFVDACVAMIEELHELKML